MLEDFDKEGVNTSEEGGHKNMEDEDEEGGGMGGAPNGEHFGWRLDYCAFSQQLGHELFVRSRRDGCFRV